MIRARACIVDGNTTAVRYVFEIFDYIREKLNNTDRVGYMLELLDPVVIPHVNYTEEQWELYRKENPLMNVRDRVEVKGGFVSVEKIRVGSDLVLHIALL